MPKQPNVIDPGPGPIGDALPIQHGKRTPLPALLQALVLLTALVSCTKPSVPSTSMSESQPSGPECLDVLGRARVWVDERVKYGYGVSDDPAAQFRDGYRTDCSGFVSYAWGLPTPGLDTTSLNTAASEVAIPDLQPGDALNNQLPGAAGHVILFVDWIDKGAYRFKAYDMNTYPGYADEKTFTLAPTDDGWTILELDEYANGPYVAQRLNPTSASTPICTGVAVLAPGAATTPDTWSVVPSGISGKIVFLQDRREGEVWKAYIGSMDADGTNITLLADPGCLAATGPFDFAPAPSGNGIAYRSCKDGSLYFVGLDGSSGRLPSLASPDLLAWSPDGNRIAYLSSNNIYVVNVNGTQEDIVYHDATAFLFWTIEWSPTNDMVVFDGGLGDGRIDPYLSAGVSSASDLAPYRLTNRLGALSIASSPSPVVRNYMPTWSPDGQSIVFVSSRDYPTDPDNYHSPQELYVMDSLGGNQKRLTQLGQHIQGVSWSPDGSAIAFQTGSALYLVGPDGSGLSRLALPEGRGLGYEEQPQWSPDGKWLLMTSNGSICLFSRDGSQFVNLTGDHAPYYEDPMWFP